VEEFQAYYELDDKKKPRQIAGCCPTSVARPLAGVILESLSQKPSGVGGGTRAAMFQTFRDNHRIRSACGPETGRVQRDPRQRGVQRGLQLRGPALGDDDSDE